MKPTKGITKRGRTALLMRVLKMALTASIALLIAVFFAFVPFRLLLPAYKIAKRGEGELRLHFLDLKGGVTIVEFPDGETLVVNAGDGSFAGDNTLCRYLRALDITSLSVMATTSAASHIGGMPALFEVFDVKTSYLPATSEDTGSFSRYRSAMQKEGCQTEKLTRYGLIANGSGAYALCLSPYSTEESDATREECSAVLYLSYGGVGVVLAGDVTQKRENQLIREYTLLNTVFDNGDYKVRLEDTQILCVSSHGSDNGSSGNWLSTLSPSVSIVCCNQSERPSDNALARIAQYSGKIYRTDELGATMVTIEGGSFEVSWNKLK